MQSPVELINLSNCAENLYHHLNNNNHIDTLLPNTQNTIATSKATYINIIDIIIIIEKILRYYLETP